MDFILTVWKGFRRCNSLIESATMLECKAQELQSDPGQHCWSKSFHMATDRSSIDFNACFAERTGI